MGLITSIYRDEYDSTLNDFHGKVAVTVTHVTQERGVAGPMGGTFVGPIEWVPLEGPFEPTPERPAAVLVNRAMWGPIVVPADLVDRPWARMFGGTFASTSDSRWTVAAGGYGVSNAVPIHDRIEHAEESWTGRVAYFGCDQDGTILLKAPRAVVEAHRSAHV